MFTENTILGIVVILLLIGCFVYFRHQTYKLRVYRFFSLHVGAKLARKITQSTRSRFLYNKLSTLPYSSTGADIFDSALKVYLNRSDDEHIFECTKALLHAYDVQFYHDSERELEYTANEMQKICYLKTGFYFRSDLLRLLLWLVVLNPVAVEHLEEL